MIIIDDDGVMHKVFTKDEVVAMLTEIQLEIEEEQGTDYHGIVAVSKGSMIDIIQEKINALKENEDGK